MPNEWSDTDTSTVTDGQQTYTYVFRRCVRHTGNTAPWMARCARTQSTAAAALNREEHPFFSPFRRGYRREGRDRRTRIRRPARGSRRRRCGMDRLGGSEVFLGRMQTGPSISVCAVGSHGRLGRRIRATFEGCFYLLLRPSMEAAAPLAETKFPVRVHPLRMNGYVHTSEFRQCRKSKSPNDDQRTTIIILMR